MRTSHTPSVYIDRDDLVLLSCRSFNDDFYENNVSATASAHLAAFARSDGEQLGTLTLAGPIVARNRRGLLYIRHSSLPDNRRTVVYELFGAE